MLRKSHKATASIATSCIISLLNFVATSATDENDKQKPALPPLVFATPADVYGNAETRKVEGELLKLLALAPRRAHGETSREKLDSIFTKLDGLVGHVHNAEQLERLAYWCIDSDKGPLPDSDFDVISSAFNSSLGWLQKRYPTEARARIYDIANVVNADGHVGEDVDGYLTHDPSVRPIWSVVCCYVWVMGGKDYLPNYNATQGTIDFNLTRFLRQKWYPYWTGKYRYVLNCSFLLLPDGRIRDVDIKSNNFGNAPTEEVRRAESAVKRILTSYCVDAHLPKLRKAIHVRADFAE